MSLAVALNSARSSLLATAQQLGVSSRNISGANDPSYSRKIAQTSTTVGGAVQVVSINRATDLSLFYRVLDSTAGAAGQQAVLDGLEQMQSTVGDTNSTDSPAAKLSALSNALLTASNAPSDQSTLQSVVTAAQDLASTLKRATQTTQAVRTQADASMSDSVSSINDLLGQLSKINTKIVAGTTAGNDVTDDLDSRDSILTKLSEQIGITVVQRPNNDVAVYTDGGVTLFDKIPRSVSFDASGSLAAGVDGNAVYVDGVPVTGDGATMPIRSGKLAGLASLRDDVTTTYQTQLDEMARGLVESFSESDQVGGGPDRTGLFTYAGGPAVPASGTAVDGLAANLQINPAVDPTQGGNVLLLRDGGINGANYTYNTTGAASYSDRLTGLTDAINAARPFDSNAQLGASTSLSSFGTTSVSWLEDQRKTASSGVEYQNALVSRATGALSNVAGVNMDDEYATQLQLEQSYAASSKLINAINQLFDTLLKAVG